MELTNTNIRYLLTIYDLSQVRLEVSSKDIAASLAVSRASVTSMMSILIDKNLVDKERYGKIHLTGLGRALARGRAWRGRGRGCGPPPPYPRCPGVVPSTPWRRCPCLPEFPSLFPSPSSRPARRNVRRAGTFCAKRRRRQA